jgi:phosphoglycolate phosphatase-like HAD superfamily hydrolase
MNKHKKKIHTVIFDLDGTLSDSALLTLGAFEHLAPDYGFNIPTQAAIRRATGNANPEFYYILFPDSPREKVFAMGQLIEQKELELLPLISDKLLFSGCKELLLRLSKLGIRLEIASTGDEEHVLSILKETNIINLFDKISYGRPDKTDMLCEIVKGNDPSCFLMVGDMSKDSDAARANGILSVGACFGYCDRELNEFDLYIDTPQDLLDIIQ